MYLCFKVCLCKHLDNPSVEHWQPLSKCCTDCLPLTYLQWIFFFSTHHAEGSCAGAGAHVVHSNCAWARRSVNSVWCAMLCTCSHKNWEMRSKWGLLLKVQRSSLLSDPKGHWKHITAGTHACKHTHGYTIQYYTVHTVSMVMYKVTWICLGVSEDRLDIWEQQ